MLKNDNPLNKDVLNKEVIPLFDPIDWQLHVESYKEILEKNQQRMNIDDPKFDLFKDSIKTHLEEMFQSQQNRSPKEEGDEHKKKFEDSLPTLVKEKFEELRSLYSNGLSKLTQKQDANKLITDVIDRDENVKMACMQSLSDIYESYMQPAFMNKLIEIIGGIDFMKANSTIFKQASKMSAEQTQKIFDILGKSVQNSPVSKEYIGLLQDFFILYIKGSGALYLLFTENDHKEFVTDAREKDDLITLSESPCVPLDEESKKPIEVTMIYNENQDVRIVTNTNTNEVIAARYVSFDESNNTYRVKIGENEIRNVSPERIVKQRYNNGEVVGYKDASNNTYNATIRSFDTTKNTYTITVKAETYPDVPPKSIIDKLGKLKETFDKLNLGNSDWDLNLCINPGFYELEDKTIFKNIYNFLLDWNRIQMYKCREKYFLKPGSQLLISNFFKQINYDYLIKKDESVKKENEDQKGILDNGNIIIDQTDIGIAFKERKEVDSTIFRCVSEKDVDIYLHNKPSAMVIAEPEPIPMGEPEDPKKNIGKAYSLPWIGSDPLNEVEKLELDEIIEQNGNDYTKTHTFVKELFAETSSTSIKFAHDNLEQRGKYFVFNEDDGTVVGLLPPEIYADGTREDEPSNEPRSIYIQYNDSIDAFGLLRMSMLGMNTINNNTNGGTAGAGELLDISYIKEYNEMVSDWTHRDLLINPERIPLLDYWDIIMDLNVTIRDNILEGKTKKIGKRIDRLTFLQSLLCCKENIQKNIDALLQYYVTRDLVSGLDENILIFSEGNDRRVKKFVLLLKKLQETDDKYIHFPYDESIEDYIQKTLKKTNAPPEKIDEFLSQKIEEVKKIFNNKEIMQIRKTLKLNHKENLKEDSVLNLIAKLHGFCKKQIEPNINDDDEKINVDDLKLIINSRIKADAVAPEAVAPEAEAVAPEAVAEEAEANAPEATAPEARQKNVLKSYLIYLNRYKDGINNMIDQIFTNNDNTLNKQNFNALIEMVVSGLDLVTGNFCGFTWIPGFYDNFNGKREYMQEEYKEAETMQTAVPSAETMQTEAPSAETMQTAVPKQTYKIFTSLVLDYYINIYNQMSMLLAKIQINNDLGKNTSIYTDMSLFDDIFKNIATDAIMLELYLMSEIKPSFEFYPSIRYIFFTDRTNVHGLREMFDSVRTGEDFDVFMNDTKINELLNGEPIANAEKMLSTKTENNTKPFFEYFLCNNVGKDVGNRKGNVVPDQILFGIVNNYDNYKYDHFYIFCKDFDKHYPYIKSFIPIFDTYVSPSQLLTTKMSELKMGLPDDIKRRNTFYTEMEITFIKHFDQFPNEKLKRKIQDILKDIFRCIKENKYQEVLGKPFLKVENQEEYVVQRDVRETSSISNPVPMPNPSPSNVMDVQIFDSDVNFNMDIENYNELMKTETMFDEYLGGTQEILPFLHFIQQHHGGNIIDFLRFDSYPNILLGLQDVIGLGTVIELSIYSVKRFYLFIKKNNTIDEGYIFLEAPGYNGGTVNHCFLKEESKIVLTEYGEQFFEMQFFDGDKSEYIIILNETYRASLLQAIENGIPESVTFFQEELQIFNYSFLSSPLLNGAILKEEWFADSYNIPLGSYIPQGTIVNKSLTVNNEDPYNENLYNDEFGATKTTNLLQISGICFGTLPVGTFINGIVTDFQNNTSIPFPENISSFYIGNYIVFAGKFSFTNFIKNLNNFFNDPIEMYLYYLSVKPRGHNDIESIINGIDKVKILLYLYYHDDGKQFDDEAILFKKNVEKSSLENKEQAYDFIDEFVKERKKVFKKLLQHLVEHVKDICMERTKYVDIAYIEHKIKLVYFYKEYLKIFQAEMEPVVELIKTSGIHFSLINSAQYKIKSDFDSLTNFVESQLKNNLWEIMKNYEDKYKIPEEDKDKISEEDKLKMNEETRKRYELRPTLFKIFNYLFPKLDENQFGLSIRREIENYFLFININSLDKMYAENLSKMQNLTDKLLEILRLAYTRGTGVKNADIAQYRILFKPEQDILDAIKYNKMYDLNRLVCIHMKRFPLVYFKYICDYLDFNKLNFDITILTSENENLAISMLGLSCPPAKDPPEEGALPAGTSNFLDQIFAPEVWIELYTKKNEGRREVYKNYENNLNGKSGGFKTRSRKPKRKGSRSKKPVKAFEPVKPVKPIKRGGGTIFTTDTGIDIDLASYDFIGDILLKIVKSRFYMEYNNYLQTKNDKSLADSNDVSFAQSNIIRSFSIPYGLLCTKGTNVQKIIGAPIPTPPDLYNLGLTTKGPHLSFNQYMTSAIENENLYLNEDVNTANQQLMKAFYHTFYKKIMTDIEKRCTDAKIDQAKSNIIVSADPITILQNMNQQNGLPVFPVEITITGKGKYFKELMTCCITEYKNNIETVKQMLLNGDDYHVALYNYIIFHVNKSAVANPAVANPAVAVANPDVPVEVANPAVAVANPDDVFNNDYLNANSILYKGRFYRQYGENLEYTSFDIHYETGPQSLKLNFMVKNHREQHRIGTIVISTSSENLYKYSIPKTININSIGTPIVYNSKLLSAGQTVKIEKDKFGLQRFIAGIKDPNHYVIYKTLKGFDKYITNVKNNHKNEYPQLIDKLMGNVKLIEQLQLDIYEDKIYFFAQKILAEHFGGKDETFFKPVTEEDFQTKMNTIAQSVLNAPFFQQNLSPVYISSYNPIFEEFKERKKNNVAFDSNLVKNSVHAKFKKIYNLYRSKNNIPDNQFNNMLQVTGKILEIPSTPVTTDIQLKQENLEGFNDVFEKSDGKYKYNPKYKNPTLISSGSNTFQKYGTNVFFENERIRNSSDYVTVCNIYDIMMRNGQASQNYGFATPGSNDRVITYSSDLNLGFNDVDIGNYAVELLQSNKKKIPVDNYDLDDDDPDDDYPGNSDPHDNEPPHSFVKEQHIKKKNNHKIEKEIKQKNKQEMEEIKNGENVLKNLSNVNMRLNEIKKSDEKIYDAVINVMYENGYHNVIESLQYDYNNVDEIFDLAQNILTDHFKGSDVEEPIVSSSKSSSDSSRKGTSRDSATSRVGKRTNKELNDTSENKGEMLVDDNADAIRIRDSKRLKKADVSETDVSETDVGQANVSEADVSEGDMNVGQANVSDIMNVDNANSNWPRKLNKKYSIKKSGTSENPFIFGMSTLPPAPANANAKTNAKTNANANTNANTNTNANANANTNANTNTNIWGNPTNNSYISSFLPPPAPPPAKGPLFGTNKTSFVGANFQSNRSQSMDTKPSSASTSNPISSSSNGEQFNQTYENTPINFGKNTFANRRGNNSSTASNSSAIVNVKEKYGKKGGKSTRRKRVQKNKISRRK